MDFRFSDEQQALIDAAGSFLEQQNTVERLRSLAAGDKTPDLWPEIAQMGLIGLLAPEEVGGLGQGLAVMAAIAEKAGYVALSEPFVEIAGLVVPLLIQLDEKERLEKILAGELKIGLITPQLAYLNDAEKCSEFLMTRQQGAEILASSAVQFTKIRSIDPLRQLSKPSLSGENNDLINRYGAILNAAQLLGLAQHMLDMSVEYAQQREQFGQAIGSFQAIKHHLANLHTQIAFSRPILYRAALRDGSDTHIAKCSSIDTAYLVAETAIQVHGGIGYTYEADLHLFMKRAWALAGEWGDRDHHMRALEHLLLP